MVVVSQTQGDISWKPKLPDTGMKKKAGSRAKNEGPLKRRTGELDVRWCPGDISKVLQSAVQDWRFSDGQQCQNILSSAGCSTPTAPPSIETSSSSTQLLPGHFQKML